MRIRTVALATLLLGLAACAGGDAAATSEPTGVAPSAGAATPAPFVAPPSTAAPTGPPPLPTVLRWVDGDTLEVQLGPGEPTTVRLLGVDTPEFRSYGGRNECVDGAIAARAAARAEALAPQGSTVSLATDGTDRYGRTLAQVATSAGDVGEQLVREGLARHWPDGSCPS